MTITNDALSAQILARELVKYADRVAALAIADKLMSFYRLTSPHLRCAAELLAADAIYSACYAKESDWPTDADRAQIEAFGEAA